MVSLPSYQACLTKIAMSHSQFLFFQFHCSHIKSHLLQIQSFNFRVTKRKPSLDSNKFRLTFRSGTRDLNQLGVFYAQANSNDRDGGVLLGRWSNDFSGGTSPLVWAGSTAILEEFWETRKTVRYGQCWVFSGLVTTCKDVFM